MTSNIDLSVQQIQQDFQALITYVTGPDTRTATAYTVELTLFRRLLALGSLILMFSSIIRRIPYMASSFSDTLYVEMHRR